MQNEPNFKINKKHLTVLSERAYGKIYPLSHPKNEPNSNPIYKNTKGHLDWSEVKSRDLFLSSLFMQIMQNKANFQNAKMNTIAFITRSYKKIHLLVHPQNETNSNPIFKMSK